MATKDESFFYSLRALHGEENSAGVFEPSINVLRSSDFEERSFTPDEIESDLDAFCGSHNILTNTDFNIDFYTTLQSDFNFTTWLFDNPKWPSTASDFSSPDDSWEKHFNFANFGGLNGEPLARTTIYEDHDFSDPAKPYTVGNLLHIQPRGNVDTVSMCAIHQKIQTFIKNSSIDNANFEELINKGVEVLDSFEPYTVSIYAKQSGDHNDKVFICFGYEEKQIETTELITTRNLKNKVIREVSRNQSLSSENKFHFAVFDLKNETCVGRNKDNLVNIVKDPDTDFYRLSMSFVPYVPDSKKLATVSFGILSSNRDNNLYKQVGGNYDNSVSLQNSMESYLNEKYPTEFAKFTNSKISLTYTTSETSLRDSSGLVYARDSVTTPILNVENINDGFLFLAPQLNIGEKPSDYGPNSLEVAGLNKDSKLSAGDAVVTRLYNKKDVENDNFYRKSDFIPLPTNSTIDLFEQCPKISKKGKLQKINGYPSLRFDGVESLYLPAFEEDGYLGEGYTRVETRAYVPREDFEFSSIYQSNSNYARAEIDSPQAWFAGTANNPSDYLQLNLDTKQWIGGVITQGRQDYAQYVKTFAVHYQDDDLAWQPIGRTSDVSEQIFVGNFDRNTKVKNLFDTPVYTKAIRIIPITYSSYKCMRADLLTVKSYSSLFNANEKFAMYLAFANQDSDYGNGGYDEERGVFRQNFAKAQILGNYNFGEGLGTNGVGEGEWRNISNFTNDLPGTFFFGIDNNQTTFRIYGENRYVFSDSLRHATTNAAPGKTSWNGAFSAAATFHNNPDWTDDGNFKDLSGTRLGIANNLEKCAILKEMQVKDSSFERWMGLRQTSQQTTKFQGWQWINGEDHFISKTEDNSDPNLWHNTEPSNYANVEHYASIWGQGTWNDVRESTNYHYCIEKVGVDNEIQFEDLITTQLKVATIVRDSGNLFRGYLNGRLVSSGQSQYRSNQIFSKDLFLGRCGSGSKFIDQTDTDPDLRNTIKYFGTGFVGNFFELSIIKETGDHTFLTNHDNLDGQFTPQQKVDYNINKYYNTKYLGDFEKFVDPKYLLDLNEEESRKSFGNDVELIYDDEWDGSFKFEWSDNPAWILYDLMINPRYGMGNQIDDLEDIDIFSLYSIGRYCDSVDSEGFFSGLSDLNGGLEPRYSCNVVFQNQENAFNTISNVASTFFGLTYWENGAFNFSIDKEKDIMAIFNNQNVFDGSFVYGDIAKSVRFTRLKVNFLDKEEHYKQKAEYVEDLAAIRKYGLIEKEMNALGATSRGQARRYGKHVLYSNLLETETVNFQAGQEALLLSPGDVFRVDDELRNFRVNYGRIKGKQTYPCAVFVDFQNSSGYLPVGSGNNQNNILEFGEIATGEEGGLFIYNQSEQSEIKKLYEMIKFEKTQAFDGVDLTDVNQIVVDNINRPQVTKFNITGLELVSNTLGSNVPNGEETILKILIDDTNENRRILKDVLLETPFSVKLSGRQDNLFKTIKVEESEPNLYNVQGLKYEPKKFEIIEKKELDFNRRVFDVGIPKNRINRPSEPSGVTFATGFNNVGKIDLTGIITGQLNGTETKYRVSLTKPNGSYISKEIEKEAGSPPQTDFTFFDLDSIGEYSLEVTSLRNPESSKTVKKIFSFDPKDDETEEIIKFSTLSISGSEVVNIDASGNRTEHVFNKDFVFFASLENNFKKYVDFQSKSNPRYDIYLRGSQEDILVKGDLNKSISSITRTELSPFIDDEQREINFKINLKKSNTESIIDVIYLNTYNNPPSIKNIEFKNSINDQVCFYLDIEQEDDLDVKRFDIFTGTTGDDFNYFFSQDRRYKTTREIIRILKENFLTESGYETGSLNYKVIPVDGIGTGYSTEISGVSLTIT